MARVIHKFTLAPSHGRQTVLLSEGAEMLSVGFQGDHLCLWAAVDPYRAEVAHEFEVALTGHALLVGPEWVCIGRADHSGPFVAHVFVMGRRGSVGDQSARETGDAAHTRETDA